MDSFYIVAPMIFSTTLFAAVFVFWLSKNKMHQSTKFSAYKAILIFIAGMVGLAVAMILIYQNLN